MLKETLWVLLASLSINATSYTDINNHKIYCEYIASTIEYVNDFGVAILRENKEIKRDDVSAFLNTKANKKVILDVDMSTDVDDVCAIRMATSMDSASLIDLVGVMSSITGDKNIDAIRGLLLHDGHSDVLIGKSNVEEPDTSPYWEVLSMYSDGGGDIDSAVRQYRKILVSANKPVDIVTTGYLTNLEYLLKSGPDDISELDGLSLLKEKGGQLYVVGGSYPDGFSNNLHYTYAARIATDYVNKNWPYPIIFSPGQTSGKLTCGKFLQERDINQKDVVTKSLYAFGTNCGRAAWDPFGVWICGHACSETNQVVLERCDLITDSGMDSSVFIPSENGRHYVVHLCQTDYNYYNVTMDNWLIGMYESIYGK